MRQTQVFHSAVRKIVVAAAAVSITIFCSAGRADDSQAGGLPALADRVLALEAATTSLKAIVAELQAANANLQAALAQETAARTAADSALQAVDSTLQTKLDQEAATRKAKDDALQSSLTTVTVKAYQVSHDHVGLVHGDRTVVADTGPLPGGNYFILGKVTADNGLHSVPWTCDLQRDDGVYIDQTSGGTSNDAFVSFLTDTPILNTAVLVLTNGASVHMACMTHEIAGSDTFDVRLIAIHVPEATFDCPDLSQPCP